MMVIPISIDGLNRSGKGTQLKLLKNALEKELKEVIIVRGDGSREGIGNPNYWDPICEWWQNWQLKEDKTYSDWNLANERLNIENNSLYGGLTNGHYFLMDRCYISTWFVRRQQNENYPLEKLIEDSKIKPKLSFVIRVPKKILLERKSDDNPKKEDFRKGVINKHYDLWENTIDKASKVINNIVYLDGTKCVDEIHKEILKTINNYNLK